MTIPRSLPPISFGDGRLSPSGRLAGLGYLTGLAKSGVIQPLSRDTFAIHDQRLELLKTSSLGHLTSSQLFWGAITEPRVRGLIKLGSQKKLTPYVTLLTAVIPRRPRGARANGAVLPSTGFSWPIPADEMLDFLKTGKPTTSGNVHVWVVQKNGKYFLSHAGKVGGAKDLFADITKYKGVFQISDEIRASAKEGDDATSAKHKHQQPLAASALAFVPGTKFDINLVFGGVPLIGTISVAAP